MNKRDEIIKREFEIPNFSGLDYGVLYDVMNSFSSKIASAREGQLIKRLKECGFEFGTKKELYEFAKNRCKLEVHANKLNRLLVDDMLIAEWWDTFEKKHEGNKVTVIAGNPPINCYDHRWCAIASRSKKPRDTIARERRHEFFKCCLNYY